MGRYHVSVSHLYVTHCTAKGMGELVDFLKKLGVEKKSESFKLPAKECCNILDVSIKDKTQGMQGKKSTPLNPHGVFQTRNEQLRSTAGCCMPWN